MFKRGTVIGLDIYTGRLTQMLLACACLCASACASACACACACVYVRHGTGNPICHCCFLRWKFGGIACRACSFVPYQEQLKGNQAPPVWFHRAYTCTGGGGGNFRVFQKELTERVPCPCSFNLISIFRSLSSLSLLFLPLSLSVADAALGKDTTKCQWCSHSYSTT